MNFFKNKKASIENTKNQSLRYKMRVYNLERNGKYFLKGKRWIEAEEVFSQLVEEEDIYWIYLAQSLLGQKKYQEAKYCFEHIFTHMIEDFEHTYEVLKGLGICYTYIRENEAAEEYINKARVLKRDFFDEELVLAYGILLKNIGEYSKAEKNFQNILEKNVNNVEAWAHISESRAYLQDIELAYFSLQKALDLDPKNKTAIKIKVRWSSIFNDERGVKDMFSFRV